MFYGICPIHPFPNLESSPRFVDVETPNLFSYTDFRKYLADWLDARREVEPGFNRAEMHRRLGLPNTRSYLPDLLAGKEMSGTFLERFVTALELSADEARFFRVLVRFNQAATAEERELAFDQLVALNRTPRTILDPRHWRYYRDWRHGAVRALLGVHDIGSEPKKIARLLQPEITEGEAKDSLALLSELGLIEKNDDGFWKPTTHTLSTGEGARDEMVRQLQAQQMRLVERAALKPDGQSGQVVATNTISVSEEGLKLIRKRLEQFRSELRSIVHKDQAPAERVHLVTMAIVPLTKADARNAAVEKAA